MNVDSLSVSDLMAGCVSTPIQLTIYKNGKSINSNNYSSRNIYMRCLNDKPNGEKIKFMIGFTWQKICSVQCSPYSTVQSFFVT